MVDLLLQAGAGINGKTASGYSALCFAARRGHTEVVRLLLTKNPTSIDAYLKVASILGQTEIVQLLETAKSQQKSNTP